MVLNNRQSFISIFGFFFVLFVVSTALGQQPDSALPQSQADKIIEKIDQLEKNMLKGMHELELKMRDHVDKKFGELDKKIDELDDRLDKLSEDVAFINGQLTNIKWVIAIFGAPLLVSIVAGIVVIIVQNNLSRKNDTKVVSNAAAETTTENRDESDEGLIQDILRDSELSESERV